MKTNEILACAAQALESKKALQLRALNIEQLSIVADCFLLCSATSSTHVRALAEEVEYQLEEKGVSPHHIEGRGTSWVLLDYGSVIVHIFTREAREFYGLDKTWADAEPIDLHSEKEGLQ